MRETPINRLKPEWNDTPTNGREQPTDAKKKMLAAEATVRSVMGNNPQLALAAAAVAGLILGWMIKRR